MRTKLTLWLAAITLAFVPAFAAAQDLPAKIHGHAQDPANTPIANGQVILSTDGKTALFTFTTDQNGDYKGEGIKPGTYYVTLFITAGKAVDRFDSVKFAAGQDVAQDFDLSRAEYVDKLPPEQKKALEEAKKRNADINKENQNVGKLNDLLKQARTANAAKKFDEANTAMLQATVIKPDAAVLWLELGVAQTGLKKYDDAATSLKKAIDLDTAAKKPNPEIQAAANNALGEVYANTNKTPDATAAYDAAAKLQPTNAAMYYTNEAVVYWNATKGGSGGSDTILDSLVSAADKAIAADPHKPIPYFLKADGLMQKSKGSDVAILNQAGESYKKYLDLAPTGQMAAQAKENLAAIQEVSKSKKK